MKKEFLMGLTAVVLSIGLMLAGCESPTNGSNGGNGTNALPAATATTAAGAEKFFADGYPVVYFAGALVLGDGGEGSLTIPDGRTLILADVAELQGRAVAADGKGSITVRTGGALNVGTSNGVGTKLVVPNGRKVTVEAGTVALKGTPAVIVGTPGVVPAAAADIPVFAIKGGTVTANDAATLTFTTGAKFDVAGSTAAVSGFSGAEFAFEDAADLTTDVLAAVASSGAVNVTVGVVIDAEGEVKAGSGAPIPSAGGSVVNTANADDAATALADTTKTVVVYTGAGVVTSTGTYTLVNRAVSLTNKDAELKISDGTVTVANTGSMWAPFSGAGKVTVSGDGIIDQGSGYGIGTDKEFVLTTTSAVSYNLSDKSLTVAGTGDAGAGTVTLGAALKLTKNLTVKSGATLAVGDNADTYAAPSKGVEFQAGAVFTIEAGASVTIPPAGGTFSYFTVTGGFELPAVDAKVRVYGTITNRSATKGGINRAGNTATAEASDFVFAADANNYIEYAVGAGTKTKTLHGAISTGSGSGYHSIIAVNNAAIDDVQPIGTNYVIPAGSTLTVPSAAKAGVASGTTITVDGTLQIDGTFVLDKTFINSMWAPFDVSGGGQVVVTGVLAQSVANGGSLTASVYGIGGSTANQELALGSNTKVIYTDTGTTLALKAAGSNGANDTVTVKNSTNGLNLKNNLTVAEGVILDLGVNDVRFYASDLTLAVFGEVKVQSGGGNLWWKFKAETGLTDNALRIYGGGKLTPDGANAKGGVNSTVDGAMDLEYTGLDANKNSSYIEYAVEAGSLAAVAASGGKTGTKTFVGEWSFGAVTTGKYYGGGINMAHTLGKNFVVASNGKLTVPATRIVHIPATGDIGTFSVKGTLEINGTVHLDDSWVVSFWAPFAVSENGKVVVNHGGVLRQVGNLGINGTAGDFVTESGGSVALRAASVVEIDGAVKALGVSGGSNANTGVTITKTVTVLTGATLTVDTSSLIFLQDGSAKLILEPNATLAKLGTTALFDGTVPTTSKAVLSIKSTAAAAGFAGIVATGATEWTFTALSAAANSNATAVLGTYSLTAATGSLTSGQLTGSTTTGVAGTLKTGYDTVLTFTGSS